MLSNAFIIFGFMLLFFSNALAAESNLQSHTKRINLHQAINKTLTHSPELRSFHYAIKAQSGRQYQAKLAASPELNLVIEDAFGSGEFKNADRAQATLSIGWVLEGDIRQGFIDVSNAGMYSLNTEAKTKRLDAAAETARLYLSCLANQARMRNALETLELAKQTVAAVKKRVNAGRAPEAELARANAEFFRRQLEREKIVTELRSAIRLLAAQWGVTQPDFNEVDGDIFNLPAIKSFDTLIAQLEQSPAFMRLLSEKRLKQAQLSLATSQSAPEWRVNLGVRHFEATSDQALLAGISIPFGERSKNVGRISEARENLSQIEAKKSALKVRYETTLFVLSEQLQYSLQRLNIYRSQIIPQLEKALKETRRAYELGRYSYFEWRSVQSDLLDARSALVEASINVHLKVIEIERLTGMPMVQPSNPS